MDEGLKCKCDLQTKLLGDGCEACNPKALAALFEPDPLHALAEQEQEPVADDALRLADALIGRNGVESVEMVAAATLRRQHAEIAELRAEVERLRRFELANNLWHEKTEWVQETARPQELGMHRADVLKRRIEKLEAEVERLREEINLMRARVVYALSDDAALKEPK